MQGLAKDATFEEYMYYKRWFESRKCVDVYHGQLLNGYSQYDLTFDNLLLILRVFLLRYEIIKIEADLRYIIIIKFRYRHKKCTSYG